MSKWLERPYRRIVFLSIAATCLLIASFQVFDGVNTRLHRVEYTEHVRAEVSALLPEDADYETAYDIMIGEARAALSVRP
jgi:hypothetical protein